MGEDDKANKSLLDALKIFEQDRSNTVKELKEFSEKNTEEQIARIRNENEQKLAEDIDFHETKLDSQIQKFYVEQLRKNADALAERSKCLYNAEKGFDLRIDTSHLWEVPFSIVYGQLSQTDPNKIGIMFPAYKGRIGNGNDFLPERIKAVALETVLKNKQELSIKEISLVEDATLAVLCLDFERLTLNRSADEAGVFTDYDQTMMLDLLLEEAFNSDQIIKHAKLKYEILEGAVINYLLPHNLMIETVKEESEQEQKLEPQERPSGEVRVAYRALEADGFISESDALRLVFNLEANAEGYRAKLEKARRVFRSAFDAGTFRDEFNNFEMKTVGNRIFYKKNKIEILKTGKKELKQISKEDEKRIVEAIIRPKGLKKSEIDTLVNSILDQEIIQEKGKNYVRLHCRYAVPVLNDTEMMKFFPHGSYSRTHAVLKYSINRQKLDKYKAGIVPILAEHILETPEGNLILYAVEDLEVIRRRK